MDATKERSEKTQGEYDLSISMILHLWDEYWTERDEKTKEESQVLRKTFSELYRAGANSPITLMFIAFTGGLEKGMELCMKIMQLKKEESKP